MKKHCFDLKHNWQLACSGRRSHFEKIAQHIAHISSRYCHNQTFSILLLLIGTLLALIWASFPNLNHQYQDFVRLPIGFHISSFDFRKPLSFWVNDILICLFFFLIGLEIKKEILVGKLNQPKLALFAICGGLGGMLVPILVFYLINLHGHFLSAWAIPMATDTAIVLSILIFFRDKLPQGIFTFLATLAIIDDVGAIIVIALFYTQSIQTMMLVYSIMLMLVLLILNIVGVRRASVYFSVGFMLWFCVEQAGFHGTLAGLLVALAIPARPINKSKVFLKRAKKIMHDLEVHTKKEDRVLKHEIHHELLEHLRDFTHQASTPLQKWENQLELPIFLLILPMFALINAGIPINKNLLSHLFTSSFSVGIMLGLAFGKPLGITTFCWVALKTGTGQLPEGSSFKHVLCVSALSGIGFTMSIFVTNQAIHNEAMILQAKAAIMVASLISASIAIFSIKKLQTRPQLTNNL